MWDTPPPPYPGASLTRKIILYFRLTRVEVRIWNPWSVFEREGNYPMGGSLCHCVFLIFSTALPLAWPPRLRVSGFWLSFMHGGTVTPAYRAQINSTKLAGEAAGRRNRAKALWRLGLQGFPNMAAIYRSRIMSGSMSLRRAQVL